VPGEAEDRGGLHRCRPLGRPHARRRLVRPLRRTIRSDGAFTVNATDTPREALKRWGASLEFRPTDGLVPVTILGVQYVANTRTGACLRITATKETR
jgi:hypothetical protein